MRKKSAIFITVRTTSSRLPQKALLKIRNQRVIEHVIDRAKLCKNANLVVLCTTTNKEDDVLVDIAKRKKIKSFRGSEKDKLVRWRDAAREFKIDYFATFDGDDFFCSPILVDLSILQMSKNPCDIIQAPQGLICGSFTFCISVKALEKVCEIKDSNETEMMWGYFTETGLFSVNNLQVRNPLYFNSKIRMTLDYAEDFAFFYRIYDRMHMKKNNVDLIKIIKMLNKNPDIPKINIFRQTQFLQNQKNKTNILLKKNINYEN